MSESDQFGFGKFVPGFDFLQNLAKGATQSVPQLPNLANWIAPTFNVEELEKRLAELKAVHFWLDQNSKALGATIQALEVQKMTLATLQGMNLSMTEVANALKLKPTDPGSSDVENAGNAAAAVTSDKERGAIRKKACDDAKLVDPLQWWGSLTQQFQQIAAQAMSDAARNSPMDAAHNLATGVAREAMKTATGAPRKASAPGSARKKTPARKGGGAG